MVYAACIYIYIYIHISNVQYAYMVCLVHAVYGTHSMYDICIFMQHTQQWSNMFICDLRTWGVYINVYMCTNDMYIHTYAMFMFKLVGSRQ